MRSGHEFNVAAHADGELAAVVVAPGLPPVAVPLRPTNRSPQEEARAAAESLAVAPRDVDVVRSETLATVQHMLCLAASAVIRGEAVLGVSSSLGLQIFVSEIGRNSLAMVSSQGNNLPPNEMEVFLKTVEPRVSTEGDEAKPSTQTRDKQEADAGDLKKQPAAPPQVIARRDDRPDEADEPPPVPKPPAMERRDDRERPVRASPPPLERSKLDAKSKPEKTQLSAASMASAGSAPSRGADVDRPPRLIHNPAPEYPPGALTNRQTGRVVLRVRVGADGRVLGAEVHVSSGVPALDEAALRAVRGWRFESALSGGAAVEQEIAVPVRFVLAASK